MLARMLAWHLLGLLVTVLSAVRKQHVAVNNLRVRALVLSRFRYLGLFWFFRRFFFMSVQFRIFKYCGFQFGFRFFQKKYSFPFQLCARTYQLGGYRPQECVYVTVNDWSESETRSD